LRPEAIVVHIIDGSFAAGESVFRNPATQKSAHYAVSWTGSADQFVDENDTAFHAGIVVNPTWPLLKPRINPNFYTIGIEHEGRPDDVWPEAQLSASATLIGEIAMGASHSTNLMRSAPSDLGVPKTRPETGTQDRGSSQARADLSAPATVSSTAPRVRAELAHPARRLCLWHPLP
jgi:hypothetical protein